MNTIDVMKQVLDVLQENHHLIEEHERPEYLALYDRQIAAFEQAIKQAEQDKSDYRFGWLDAMEYARQNGVITSQPVPVKTYSGGKAWPVQVDKCRRELQKSGQYLCDCLEGKCPDSKG